MTTKRSELATTELDSTEPPEGWVRLSGWRCKFPENPSTLGFVADMAWRYFFNKKEKQEYYVQIHVPTKRK